MKLEKNKDYRIGNKQELEKEGVIIWIKNRTDKKVKIIIKNQ
jgi:hypothetical protein